jgi:uncharacterized Zn finger protein
MVYAPCKFCDATDGIHLSSETVRGRTYYFVRCRNCGADGPHVYRPSIETARQVAINMWALGVWACLKSPA